MVNTLTSIFCRLFFAVALLLIFISLWDKFISFFGWSLLWVPYTPGRVFEFSAMLMTVVIALLLRQIREELKNK